jgi:AcrR family transcriptional regulator
MAKPPLPKRTQASRSQASRTRIIQEATRLFGQAGYRGTRLADIARAVNMTEPGVLHHFGSKENLLISVLQERDRIDEENYAHTVGREEFEILAALRSLVEHNETVPGLVQLFTLLVAESIPSGHPSHDYFISRYQSSRVVLAEEIRKAQQKGSLRNDLQPEMLAAMLFAMMDGLQIQWLLQPQELGMTKIFDRFLELLQPQ